MERGIGEFSAVTSCTRYKNSYLGGLIIIDEYNAIIRNLALFRIVCSVCALIITFCRGGYSGIEGGSVFACSSSEVLSFSIVCFVLLSSYWLLVRFVRTACDCQVFALSGETHQVVRFYEHDNLAVPSNLEAHYYAVI